MQKRVFSLVALSVFSMLLASVAVVPPALAAEPSAVAVAADPYLGHLTVPVRGLALDGTQLTGTLKIFRFDYSRDLVNCRFLDISPNSVKAIGSLVLSTLDGRTAVTQVEVPVTVGRSAAPAGLLGGPGCDILTLGIGAIHLEVLGLAIDLSLVHLEFTAAPGPGNLLGDLLCAIVGLLDPNGQITNPLRLVSNLNRLLDLLNGLGA